MGWDGLENSCEAKAHTFSKEVDHCDCSCFSALAAQCWVWSAGQRGPGSALCLSGAAVVTVSGDGHSSPPLLRALPGSEPCRECECVRWRHSHALGLVTRGISLLLRRFWLTLFIVVQFSYEALASWHCSLHNPLFHKDHSALLSTPSPNRTSDRNISHLCFFYFLSLL